MQTALAAPRLVETPVQLDELLHELRGEREIAVDTEANSLHAYRERVCLIQFSTSKNDYIVDPLSLDNLSSLAGLFANPGVEKIFHDAEYDLLGLHRDFKFTFSNLYDTKIAARVLGYKSFGLGILLQDKFGVEVNKRYQKADWGKRPLSGELIDYACLDTHYLIQLRDQLESELKQSERWDLAHEDFRRSCLVNAGNNHHVARERWERVDGKQELTPRQRTILNELCICREKMAERLDRPLFKVMDDQHLIDIARAEPQSIDDLEKAGLSTKQINLFGTTILEAVQRGLKAPIVHRTEIHRPSAKMLNLLNRLKTWRKRKAKEMDIDSDVILPRSTMFSIAEEDPSSLQTLAPIMEDTPWRLENFGEEILKAMH